MSMYNYAYEDPSLHHLVRAWRGMYTYVYEDPSAWGGIKLYPYFGWHKESQYVDLGVGPDTVDVLQHVPDGGFTSQEEFDSYCREAIAEMGPAECRKYAYEQLLQMRKNDRRMTLGIPNGE